MIQTVEHVVAFMQPYRSGFVDSAPSIAVVLPSTQVQELGVESTWEGLMTTSVNLSPSVVVRLLQEQGDGIRAVDLIDKIVECGYDVDEAVRAVRGMLNSGDIGLGSEMDIRLLRQPA